LDDKPQGVSGVSASLSTDAIRFRNETAMEVSSSSLLSLAYDALVGSGDNCDLSLRCQQRPAGRGTAETGLECGAAPLLIAVRTINERRAGMRHVQWSVVMGCVVVALGVGVLVQAQQPLSGEYKIGVLEPLTGNLAAEGKRHLEGYELMRDLINDRFGGVMGKKLVFVTGDAVDPTVAASEATRLATRVQCP